MKLILACILWVSSFIANAQEIDTLSFFSNAFNKQRSVYVYTPESYKYQSEAVKLPVIYILDGQHEWFVNPLLSDIDYLQYTHQIPEAIVVFIPHENRVKECSISDLKTSLPLDIFITEELDTALEKYHPNDFKLLIGHSFSASFSLYSYNQHPNYYAGIIAHTPLDALELLIHGLEENPDIDEDHISISIGSIGRDKDYHHRKNYNTLKEKYPDFFNSIHTFEADYSAHNAVPIVSTPTLLTQIFNDFSSRYTKIAEVNDDYKLIESPKYTDVEIQKVMTASKIGSFFYAPQISDLNGIASRYSYSGYNDFAIEIYKMGIEYYPNYYEFYLSLYDLTLTQDEHKAKEYLTKATLLLTQVEGDWDGKNELLDEINAEKQKNGW